MQKIPVLSLAALDAQPMEFETQPTSGNDARALHFSPHAFCLRLTEEDKLARVPLVELEAGDLVYIEPDDVLPRDRSIFLVRLDGQKEDEASLLLAENFERDLWRFRGTGPGGRSVVANNARVIGRLHLICRTLGR